MAEGSRFGAQDCGDDSNAWSKTLQRDPYWGGFQWKIPGARVSGFVAHIGMVLRPKALHLVECKEPHISPCQRAATGGSRVFGFHI